MFEATKQQFLCGRNRKQPKLDVRYVYFIISSTTSIILSLLCLRVPFQPLEFLCNYSLYCIPR